MVDLIERLREWCRDWDGSDMADAAETRTTVDCRTMREAADELTALRERVVACEAVLTDAREKLAWSFHYMIEPDSHPTIKRIDAILAKQGGEDD